MIDAFYDLCYHLNNITTTDQQLFSFYKVRKTGGLTQENAGGENAIRAKLQGWKIVVVVVRSLIAQQTKRC